jgi:hypothetical protein
LHGANNAEDHEIWEESDTSRVIAGGQLALTAGAAGALAVRTAQTGANGIGVAEDEAHAVDTTPEAVLPMEKPMAFNWREDDVGAEDRDYSPPMGQGAPGGSHGEIAVLTSSSEEAPARTSPPQDSEPDSPEPAPASFSSSSESLTLFSGLEDGFCLRTYPDYFPPLDEISRLERTAPDETSQSFSRRWPTSGFMTSPGECWTADTSECPSGGGAFSSLPDVLEADVPQRFYLTPKAAAGILRRALKRGRLLPMVLMRALVWKVMRAEEDDPAREILRVPVITTTWRTLKMELSPPTPEERIESPWPSPPGEVRRLTPTECERLQGLPDGWTWVLEK